MARKILTGLAELESTMRHLSDKAADRVSRSALGGGLTVLAREIKKQAPVGPTKTLKKSIKKRFIKGKRGQKVTAKAGVNVGKKKKDQSEFVVVAPHGHLVGLGTAKRVRKRIGGRFGYLKNPSPQQLSTGTMPSNAFVKRGTSSAASKILAAMKKRAEKAVIRETKKAAKR